MTAPTYLPLLATDFESIKQELINRVSVNFPDWSDKQDSNNMLMLIEMFAGIQEQTLVYLNRQARECFLQHAQDPANVVELARGMGYEPQYQTPASVSAMLTSSAAFQGSTPIRAGTKFATNLSNVFYETTTDFTWPAGTSQYGPVVLWQQETWPISGLGSGVGNQTVSLLKTPVLPDTINLIIDGETWTKVDHFVDSVSTSKHFLVKMDLKGRATLYFGDGVNGRNPSAGSTLGGTYKTGGGKAGSITANQLRQCVSEIIDNFSGQSMAVTAVNADAATPGGDRETPDQTRVRARSNLKAPRSLLTLEDVEAHVSQLPGVEAVKALNWLSAPSLPHHIVQIFVAPLGAALNGQAPSPTLIASVENLVTVEKPIVMGNVPQVLGPTYHVINYTINVGIKSGYEAVDVISRVTAQMQELFDPSIENVWGFKPAFGFQIYESHLLMILQQVAGVRNVDILSPGDVLLQYNEYPKLGTLEVVAS